MTEGVYDVARGEKKKNKKSGKKLSVEGSWNDDAFNLWRGPPIIDFILDKSVIFGRTLLEQRV